ncbi:MULTISPECIES: hypothetical protein [unclassified Aeromicrobium]|uniref:hypothetical protein n=1 Tax=unclassified Aeromicrobium TaxID=2633570 RepID=UPI00396B170B
MNRTIRVVLAGAAMGLVLGGCTGSADEPEAQAKPATPQEQWVQSLCKALEPTTAPVEPPATGGSAAESQEAIVGFLRTLRDRLEAQAAVLDDAGAPPEVDPASFDQAKESLASGAKTLQGVIKNLKAASSEDADQMEATLLQVSESLAESSSYQGPLAELSASDEGLKQAFEDDKTCASIMS